MTRFTDLVIFYKNQYPILHVLPSQRDPVTGEEPNDLDLWYITHTEKGEWKDQASKDVYVSSC